MKIPLGFLILLLLNKILCQQAFDPYVDLINVKINHISTKSQNGKDFLCFDNGIANIGTMNFIVKTNKTDGKSFDAYQQVYIYGQPNQDIFIGNFEYDPTNSSNNFMFNQSIPVKESIIIFSP